MIFIFIITINQYLNHQMYATTKRVSLPINNPFETKQADQITIDTDQHQVIHNTIGSYKYMMPVSHHKLYGMSKLNDPTTTTTLCLYKPNKHQNSKLHEDYDLDTYLNTYVSQHS